MGKQSEKIGAQLKKQIATMAKALTLQIDANVRKATPVDTGHARANWVPSVGSPHSGEVQGGSAHDQGVTRVLAFKLEDGALYVSNAVPYVPRLNDGHSKQAPSLFIETAVDQAVAKLKQRYAGPIALEKEMPVKPEGGDGGALDHGAPVIPGWSK